MISNLRVVILNMNLKDDTIVLIDSLLQAGLLAHQIILVDNGSKDGSVNTIQDRYGNQISIIANEMNMGFAIGSNQGFERAMELGADWVLLINNDTVVPEDFFVQFEDFISSNSPITIFAPVIFYYDQSEVIWHMGATRIPGTILAHNLYHGKKLSKNLPPIISVDFISGCAMFIKSEVVKKIGLFDPRFFAYWEEIDFCCRARAAGYKIGILTRTKMWHKVAMTARKDRPKRRYLYTRNMIYYSRKNAKGLQKPVMAAYLLIRFGVTLIKDTFSQRKELIQPMVEGWKDGWDEASLEA
jgi:GT2 family glycosyltransferase